MINVVATMFVLRNNLISEVHHQHLLIRSYDSCRLEIPHCHQWESSNIFFFKTNIVMITISIRKKLYLL